VTWYAERKAAGLCVKSQHCKRKAEPGRSMCEPCRKCSSRTVAKIRQRRIAQGICQNYGCNRPSPAGVRCDVCAARQKEYKRAWYLRNKARQQELVRRYRKRRRTAGLCVCCNQPAETKDHCRKHRILARARAEKARRARGMKPRPARRVPLPPLTKGPRTGDLQPMSLREFQATKDARAIREQWGFG
jgi:hypothetical protein